MLDQQQQPTKRSIRRTRSAGDLKALALEKEQELKVQAQVKQQMSRFQTVAFSRFNAEGNTTDSTIREQYQQARGEAQTEQEMRDAAYQTSVASQTVNTMQGGFEFDPLSAPRQTLRDYTTHDTDEFETRPSQHCGVNYPDGQPSPRQTPHDDTPHSTQSDEEKDWWYKTKYYLAYIGSWIMPTIAALGKSLLNAFGLKTFVEYMMCFTNFVMGGAFVANTFVLTNIILPIILVLSVCVMMVSLGMEGLSSHKRKLSTLTTAFGVDDIKGQYDKLPKSELPYTGFTWFCYATAFFFASVFEVIAPWVTGLYKGASAAGGTVGILTFTLSALGFVTAATVSAMGLYIVLTMLAICIGVCICDVSMSKEGAEFSGHCKTFKEGLAPRLWPENTKESTKAHIQQMSTADRAQIARQMPGYSQHDMMTAIQSRASDKAPNDNHSNHGGQDQASQFQVPYSPLAAQAQDPNATLRNTLRVEPHQQQLQRVDSHPYSPAGGIHTTTTPYETQQSLSDLARASSSHRSAVDDKPVILPPHGQYASLSLIQAPDHARKVQPDTAPRAPLMHGDVHDAVPQHTTDGDTSYTGDEDGTHSQYDAVPMKPHTLDNPLSKADIPQAFAAHLVQQQSDEISDTADQNYDVVPKSPVQQAPVAPDSDTTKDDQSELKQRSLTLSKRPEQSPALLGSWQNVGGLPVAKSGNEYRTAVGTASTQRTSDTKSADEPPEAIVEMPEGNDASKTEVVKAEPRGGILGFLFGGGSSSSVPNPADKDKTAAPNANPNITAQGEKGPPG